MKNNFLSSNSFFLLCVYLVASTACSNRSLSADYMENLFKEYGIQEYNYLVADSNETLTLSNYNEKITSGKKWIENFSLPLILINEIRKGQISEDSLLSYYMAVRSTDKEMLRLKDLIYIPENRLTIFPQYNDNTQFYLKHLIREQFPNAYHNFNEKILMIDENHPWDTQSVMEVMKHLDAYFDKQNITEYLPIGEDIPELFPTWYVENIFQLAGWYTFRINKHVVLWNSMTDDSQTLLCIKFIDLGKNVIITYPHTKELFPFDSNGNPDILLSPLALDIIKNTLDPDCSKIDFNSSKEDLNSQLKKKKESPYLPLYIKELQIHIMQADKKRDQDIYKKLHDIYVTSFPYSLPYNYLSASPIASINYVYDRMNASRYFTLDKESPITILYTNQRQKYINNDSSINDSIVFADKCWIINEQSKEIVWEPTIDPTIPVNIIKVERCDTTLNPGKYMIRYKSDREHSFESWLSKPPHIDNYGIRIYMK